MRLRYSHTNPGQITGWSVVAPPDKRARTPKAFAGRTLGSDCTWPALMAHINARGLSDGLGIIHGQEGQAMIDRARMAAAGWGAEFIDQVIANDQALIDAGPDADPALAYWMRDVFWQVAWTLEQSHGRHGVWTDAAYLYSAIATGGPPAPPTEIRAALDDLHAQYDLARAYLDSIEAHAAHRDEEAAAMAAAQHGRGPVGRLAGGATPRPQVPVLPRRRPVRRHRGRRRHRTDHRRHPHPHGRTSPRSRGTPGTGPATAHALGRRMPQALDYLDAATAAVDRGRQTTGGSPARRARRPRGREHPVARGSRTPARRGARHGRPRHRSASPAWTPPTDAAPPCRSHRSRTTVP